MFYTAFIFLEILKVFGELEPEVSKSHNYLFLQKNEWIVDYHHNDNYSS
jgi:hypothetical protein